MKVSFSPIGPWYLVALASLAVMILTIWAYQQRLRGTSGSWRWFALGLRLLAVLLCLLAALRPSFIVQEKKKEAASLVFLIDSSKSMTFGDAIGGQKRWEAARKVLDDARAVAKSFGKDLDVKYLRFDASVRDDSPDHPAAPEGSESNIGAALLEASENRSGPHVAAMYLLSDGANNGGVAPMTAARRLRSQQIPVYTVGFGSEQAGPNSKDIAIKDLVSKPTVFVKNVLQVQGTLLNRGFANQPLDVEMLVEDKVVAQQTVKVPEGTEMAKIDGLKYIPQSPGEKKITLRVKPEQGELIQTNNEISTFITVLKGGLNVLDLQGPNFTWEYKFLARSVMTSPDIQVDLKVIRRPAQADRGEVDDKEFAPGRYDVYILGDLPADALTRAQQRLLTHAVEQGAGLIMLGGRSSFGPGGWGSTELARMLPSHMHPGDPQLEPPNGLKFLPNRASLDSYVLQVGRNQAETTKIWNEMPPLPGANHLGRPKDSANILAYGEAARPEPLMIGIELGKARVLAFGGETWVWARASDEGRAAHRKFWRQVIFWLAHKENEGENQVKITLDRRRVARGQKLDVAVNARDAKGQPLKGVTFEAKVSSDTMKNREEPLEMFPQGDEGRAPYFALGQPGEYKVTVVGKRDGQVIGRDSARFLVYQDDRELENPAADLGLLRQIAEVTGGVSLAPEELIKHLGSMNGKVYTEHISQTEHKVWDNWPFLLLFAAVLTLEWWLRKRNGWV